MLFNNDKLQHYSKGNSKRQSVTERAMTPHNLPKVMLSEYFNLCPEAGVESKEEERVGISRINERKGSTRRVWRRESTKYGVEEGERL